MTSDLKKGFIQIGYDRLSTPRRIHFSNGSATRYVYSATGQKLRTVHYTAPANIHVSMGDDYDIEHSYLAADSTDYLLGGTVVFSNNSFSKILFDGGYVDLDDNGAPTGWNYYVTDHLGSMRKVVDSNDSIRETISYYPFGSEMRMQDPSQMTGDFQHPYRFTGKELDRLNGLNMYDFGARWFDVAGVPMWTSVDPLAEKYYPFTPYSYCAGDPVNRFDPDGRSTKVKALYDGTYKVIGGDINDNDRNIYLYTQDEKGDFSVRGEPIGASATLTSFYNSDKEDPSQRWGGIINPNDNSGVKFLNNIMGEDSPSLLGYMYHARTGHKYDFKVTNGTDSQIDGIDPQRGMPISTNSDENTTYASARDIGNMAAGYIAAKNGISWKAAREAFDWYQGGPEGKTTVNAEAYGYFVLGRNTPAQKLLRILRRKK